MRRWEIPIIIILAVVAAFAAPRQVQAQVPTASGRTISMSNAAWSLFIPSDYVPRGNVADVIYHFHGDPATFRNNAKFARLNAIIVTINYGGLSSAYQTPFQNNQSLFATIKNEALAKVRAQADFPDTLVWDQQAVSSFSAGYGAVREILKSQAYYDDIDAVAALDSIYAGFVSYPVNLTLVGSQMVDWRRFAVDAKNGLKSFVLSHSQVDPVTYASTVLTANDLLAAVGGTAQVANYDALGTLHIYRTAHLGNFKLFGATGADGDSHLEHLRFGGEFLNHLPLARVPEPTGASFLAAAAVLCLRCRASRSSR